MNFGEKPKRRININITSLVDILIVLLLFFMLTSQFIRMELLNVSLSGASSVKTTGDKLDKNITITLVGPGRFLFEGEEFDLLFLKDKIRPFLTINKERAIVIFSMPKASVQDVVTAMDYIRAIGGTNISLAEDNEHAGKS